MPRIVTWLTRTTGVKYPFIQGGLQAVATAELVAAVAGSGCLGFLSAFTQPDPESLRNEIRKVKSIAGSNAIFGVNFTMLPALNPPNYAAFAQVAVDEGITIFETAGNPKPVLKVLQAVPNAIIIHKCISIYHALKAEKLGVSAISIDGFECAGHPGEEDVTSLVLVARAKQSLKIPVIASGGFADGRGSAAALAMGADGVNMGSRWLCTVEAPIHVNVKKAIVAAKETDTALLLKPLNNSVRCFNNKVAKAVLAEQEKPEFEFSKVASLMSGARGREVYKTGDIEEGIWSLGQAAGLIHDIPTCGDLAKQLNADTVLHLRAASNLIQEESKL